MLCLKIKFTNIKEKLYRDRKCLGTDPIVSLFSFYLEFLLWMAVVLNRVLLDNLFAAN